MSNKYTVISYVKDEGKYFLRAMLNSVTGVADEIIMIDNGSSDNTVAIIREFPKVRLLEIETTPDEIATAINAGIQQASNPWLLIQAGDEVWLPEQINKIPGMIDEMIALNKRIGMIQYLDFVGDVRHYHTKYICWASRIWKNECGFHFGGDWMGEIYMGYDDGIQTGGITVKKNLPEQQVHRRGDITFFHYARCKPVEVLKRKRKLYWQKRVAPEQVKQELEKDAFYTLQFGDKISYYDGEIPKFIEQRQLSQRRINNMRYIDYLRRDYAAAIKQWRWRYHELTDEEWTEGVNLTMSYGGKKQWERNADAYEEWILRKIKLDVRCLILDAGCGYGYLLHRFYDMGFRNLYGMDLSAICVEICQKRFQERGVAVNIMAGNLIQTGYESNSFHIVTCTEVLEHDKYPSRIVQEIYRILKPGGRAYFSTPYLDRRQAWNHINFMHTSVDNPEAMNLPVNLADYNLINIDELFKLYNHLIELDKGNKFLLIEIYK